MTGKRTYTAKRGKKHIELLLTLYSTQPWLTHRNEAVMELWEHCDSFDEFILICELLQRFTYIEGTTFVEFINRISSHITDYWSLPAEETIIAATTANQDPDSAQVVIYQLSQVLSQKGGYDKPGRIFFNTIHKAHKEMSKRAGIDNINNINIVFVDEFVGTGNTMESRIRSTRKYLERGCGISVYDIKVCVLASMEQGKEYIDSLGVDCYAHTVLKKGIAGHISGEELEKAYREMLRLESTLAPEIAGIELPSLGYGKAEALYARQDYADEVIANTPNSVFPIFWWPKYLNATTRKTILHRALYNDRYK